MRTRHVLVPTMAFVVLVATSACAGATGPTSHSAAAPPGSVSSPASAGAPPSSAPTVAGDWLGFRGDASHSGIAAAGPVGHPVLNWQYHAKAAVPRAIAVVADQVSFASDDGTVYALDRMSGKERWVINLGSGPLIGPWAADGRLYFLNGAGAAVALEANTGKTLWTSVTTYDGVTEPVVRDGTVYFGTGDGRLVAIDGATGTEQWAVKPSPSTTWVGNPAVANGRLYAGTSGGYVAVDLASHELAWIGDTNGDQTGSASVNEGIAFIAAGHDSPATHARAFDAATGQLRWSTEQPGLTFPVAADGTAFSSTMQGLVQALDLQTGKPRWSIQLSGEIRPMAVANHVLYVAADTERHLYAVDTATGGKLWQFDVDDSNDCCVAVAGGTVYVGTMNGSVYSIGGDGATIAAQPFATAAPTQRPRRPRRPSRA